MITTLRYRIFRMLCMSAALAFMAAVFVLTGQQSEEDRVSLRTRVEVQAEKMSAIENWRSAVEATKIPERLATLESQIENNNWLLRGVLGGLGLLVLEMLGRLFLKIKKE